MKPFGAPERNSHRIVPPGAVPKMPALRTHGLEPGSTNGPQPIDRAISCGDSVRVSLRHREESG
jgi:hypothetical protein